MSNEEIITKTNDGYVVELFVKKGITSKIETGLEGISILKLDKSLGEDELYSTYAEIVEKMDYNPIIIKAPEIQKEENVVKIQIRAMLRAAAHGDMSIIFPNVSTIQEIRNYKSILEECQNELNEEKIPYKKHMKIGIIVEIPSVALESYELARECDFLFIDTDSLTNNTFKNNNNTESADKLQLSVMKLIQQTIIGAHDAGVFCGISGQALENQMYIPLLIGLGIDQFSIDLDNVPKVRKVINQLDKSECKELVEEVFQQKTLEEIERKLKQFIQN